MRSFVLQILLAIIVLPAARAGTRSICFISEGTKRATRLRFDFPDSESELGEVHYEKGHGAIKIKRLKEIEVARHGDRPSEVQTNFVEILDKGEGGTYQIVTQGAIVLGLKFLPRAKGKPIAFKHDEDGGGEDECGWKAKP